MPHRYHLKGPPEMVRKRTDELVKCEQATMWYYVSNDDDSERVVVFSVSRGNKKTFEEHKALVRKVKLPKDYCPDALDESTCRNGVIDLSEE